MSIPASEGRSPRTQSDLMVSLSNHEVVTAISPSSFDKLRRRMKFGLRIWVKLGSALHHRDIGLVVQRIPQSRCDGDLAVCSRRHEELQVERRVGVLARNA